MSKRYSGRRVGARWPIVVLVVLVLVVLVIIIVAVSTLSGQIAAAVIAGLGTVLASVLSIILTKHWEKTLEIEQEHLKQKIPIYEDFLISWFTETLSARHNRMGEAKKEPSFMFKFAVRVLLWGSDEVIRQYSNFRHDLARISTKIPQSVGTPSAKTDYSISGFDVISSIESLILTIRSDIGHKNKGLKKGDLLSVVFDVKEIDMLMRDEMRK